MDDHVYSVTEIVGSSGATLEEAIGSAVAAAAQTQRDLEWFEVTQIRGHINGSKVAHYQVEMKIGRRYEGK